MNVYAQGRPQLEEALQALIQHFPRALQESAKSVCNTEVTPAGSEIWVRQTGPPLAGTHNCTGWFTGAGNLHPICRWSTQEPGGAVWNPGLYVAGLRKPLTNSFVPSCLSWKYHPFRPPTRML